MKSPTLCPTCMCEDDPSAGLAHGVFAAKLAEKLGIPCRNIVRAQR